MSVKRSIRRERPEAVLFERSEFTDDSERRMRSSEAGAALIFCLLFHQGKSRFNYATLLLNLSDKILRQEFPIPMNDIFSAFGAEQALGLGIGEHAAFFEGFQQVFATMFDDEER